MKNPLFILFLVLLFTLRADELYLHDGRKIDGVITENGDEYIIRRDDNSAMRVPKYEVLRLEKKLTTEQLYENLRAVCDEQDVTQLLNLAQWCRQNNLVKPAKELYAKVIALEPLNVTARKGAGFILYKNEWLTREEYQRAHGKEFYKGEWLDRAIVEKKLAEDAEHDAKKRNRQQANEILQSAAKRPLEMSVSDLSKQLAELSGSNVMTILQFAAGDSNLRIRETAYEALTQREEEDAFALLCRRIATETNPRLYKKLIALITAYQPSEKVIDKMLDLALHASGLNTRQTAWIILRNLGDTRIIEPLIKAVDFCPIPEEARKDENVSKVGEVNVRQRKPYYPAHELLVFLTHEKFAVNEKEEWEKWWTKNKEDFKIKKNLTKNEP